ncbi:MAG: hypothetical protein J5506_10470 [Prevotella sp.]|nr:hypothetical protein [Prevotella sp.]
MVCVGVWRWTHGHQPGIAGRRKPDKSRKSPANRLSKHNRSSLVRQTGRER